MYLNDFKTFFTEANEVSLEIHLHILKYFCARISFVKHRNSLCKGSLIISRFHCTHRPAYDLWSYLKAIGCKTNEERKNKNKTKKERKMRNQEPPIIFICKTYHRFLYICLIN